MKRFVRIVLAALLLACAASTASLADGGSPFPKCSPSNCPAASSPSR
jgi:hypothetical protein